ncbi:glycerate kinase [uncultured Paludibaculum sp.]|uniref:glycerate kinase type-2 family protein n=1 Tax=uncultured Paludibaculum sp. TaxID=1765020 RepID=UPI002AAC0644|nr:glycerate kinase [uncultured Paludibaculum sp.]
MSLSRILRRDAQAIFKAAVAAAQPETAVLAALKNLPVHRYRRIFVLGAGKASAAMAHAVERALGKRVTAGLVNTKDGHLARLKRVQLNECGHPVPDQRGVDGARQIARLAGEAEADDLVLCLISGGGSALLPLPAPPITLAEKQVTTKLLLGCGATIHELNAVRKHLSLIKGGQLARLAAPATVISLMLSDVVGDPLDVIGSGPTAPDPSTFQSAWTVIEKYGLATQLPAPVRERLQAGLKGEVEETPKAGDPCFEGTRNLVIGSNLLAVKAASAKAKDLGYKPVVLSTTIEGETKDVAFMHAAIAREARATGRPAKPPVCFISGGETTVTIRGDGLGGRNQEFALAAALVLDGQPGVLAFSGGTDGTDGPTDAAGAMADGDTVRRAAKLGLNAASALGRNDSYNFFSPLGDLVKTGPTGTNVMDVRLLLLQ